MILVTGGAGFIGAAVCRALVARGAAVRAFDNYSRGRTLVDGVSYHDGDVRNLHDVIKAMKGCDEVIHLAYINGTETFYKQPELVLEVAVKGMVHVLDACRFHGVKRLLLASSSEVCRAKLVDTEEAIPLVIPDPLNPRYSYSAGKIISEMMCLHCKALDRLVIVRPFNIYGPGMAPGHVVPDFIARLRDPSKRFHMVGSGSETRSFCYIDDFIDGLLLARDRGAHRDIFNIGNPDEVTILQLAHLIADLMGRTLGTVVENGFLREGDAPRRKPDISKLMALGYRPKIPLAVGLQRCLDALSVVPA